MAWGQGGIRGQRLEKSRGRERKVMLRNNERERQRAFYSLEKRSCFLDVIIIS